MISKKKSRQVFVCIIGADGSGKTTTSEGVINALVGEGRRARKVWCGAESYLMAPIRWILSILNFKRRNTATKTSKYPDEIKRKNSVVNRLAFFKGIYIGLVLLDFRLQYRWRLWACRNEEVVVLDRYFYDVAVNLAVVLGWSESELSDFIMDYGDRFRLPDIRIHLYVSPEESMRRKDDIPDISYIRMRSGFYNCVARTSGFTKMDGTLAVQTNVTALLDAIGVCSGASLVHYVHSNNEDLGGADFCLSRMADEFNKTESFRATVSLRLRSGIEEQYLTAGIPVFRHPFVRPQLSRGALSLLVLPVRSLMSVVYFVRLFRRHRPNIVHVNDLYDFLPVFAAKLVGIPVCWHVRMIRTNPLEKKIFSLMMKRLSNFSLSVSESVRQTYFPFPETLGTHSAQVVFDWPSPQLVKLAGAIENPSEFEGFQQIVVMVGRLEFWKGQHVFLAAVSRLKNRFPNVGFFLVGGSVKGAEKFKYAEAILREASRVGVVALGSRSDVATLLRASTISVHASVTPDPFPGVVLESMLASSGTIGVDDGGVSEMIRHEEDGLLYPAGDDLELSNQIARLLTDETLRYRIANSGRQRILELTNKQKIVDQISTMYRELGDHYIVN